MGTVGTTNTVPGPSPLNQEFIIVFAGNNLLGDAGVLGNNGGFGDIRLTAPATGKNVITVTASENVRLDGSGCAGLVNEDNSFDIWQGSAFGPTADGRFKPEVVAPGTTIYAARSLLAGVIDPVNGITPVVNEDPNGNLGTGFIFSSQVTNLYCAPPQNFTNFFPNPRQGFVRTFGSAVGSDIYDCSSGSSYAAPAVSGGIQLLWWYFQHRLTNELGQALLQPSPAMAKAYVCNSARYLPITNPQTGATDTLPSTAQGMGELDLARMFDGVGRAIRDESTPRAIDVALITTNPAAQQSYFSQAGQSYELSGQVASNGLPFRVTLAWTDAPGTPLAAKELVNNLDLQVIIGGVTYKGNVFAQSVSVPGGGFDSVNNMESVFVNPVGALGGIPAVTSGAPWQVIVRAVDIAGDGVPNVGGSNDQDFALIVYNAATNTLSDVANLTTNNACQTAINIVQFPYTFTNTLSKALYHNVHPSPSVARGGIDEFFKITLPTPGTTFTIDTFGSSFDTVLSVWKVQVLPQTVFVRGECGALTEVVANNDVNGGLQSQVSFTSDGSNDYYIVVEPHNDGSGGKMALNVRATNPPITLTPPSLAFSDQVVGTTSPSQTVVYQNNAPVPVNIDTVSITGANAGDFVLTSQTCEGNKIITGTNCFAVIAFAPTGTGLRTANLVFTDDAIGSPRSVPLSGNGTPPAPLICSSSSATSTLVFSSQLVTTTSTVQSVTLTNCGSAPLNVSSVSITGFGTNDFTITTPTCTGAPIAPGSFCTIGLVFDPVAAGTRNANLVITHDATGSPTTIGLTGIGTALLPAICFTPTSVNFGNVVVGFTGTVRSVTITNCGTAPLVISNVTITGANAGDFIFASNACTNTVATGSTCQVSLEFAPTAGGVRSANLTYTDNISGGPQFLPLLGGGNTSQPDAAIGVSTKPRRMVGSGITNTSGAGQEVLLPIRRGSRRPVRFYVSLKNTGSGADRFTVQGNVGITGFTVNYFLGAILRDSTDVSSAVESGVFSSSTLAPAAITSPSTMIRVEVYADKTLVGPKVNQTFTLTFTSASDPTKIDVVKATVRTR